MQTVTRHYHNRFACIYCILLLLGRSQLKSLCHFHLKLNFVCNNVIHLESTNVLKIVSSSKLWLAEKFVFFRTAYHFASFRSILSSMANIWLGK
jgi:hypothetical protein